MTKTMERIEAAKLGLMTYNTGRRCKHGHEPIRYTVSGVCVECAKLRMTNWRKGLKQTIAEGRKARALAEG